MIEVLLDTLIDTLKLIPFFFATYLLMEFIEHKAGEKSEETIRKAGRFGPALGAVLGLVPQCGFSAGAASLYSGGLISAGTLLAVFLSTSDEMLPILVSEKAKPSVLIEILLIKLVIALVAGFTADIIIKLSKKGNSDRQNRRGRRGFRILCRKEGR